MSSSDNDWDEEQESSQEHDAAHDFDPPNDQNVLGQPAANVSNVDATQSKATKDVDSDEQEDAVFKAQLVSAVSTLQHLTQHPRFAKMMQSSPVCEEKKKKKKRPRDVESSATHGQPSQHKFSNVQALEMPIMQGPSFQPTSHVYDANVHRPGNVLPHVNHGQPVIPQPSSHPGYFGGGSVFQAMAGNAYAMHGMLGNQIAGFQPAVHGLQGNEFASMQPGMTNAMYGNIGMQPGMQSGFNASMPGPAGLFGMRESGPSFANPLMGVGNASMAPFLQAPMYDNLTPKGKSKDYKEGGAAVKFETFNGTQDRLKALTFIQQFDAAYSGGNFTESSKVRKAATFLKGNALQWWTTLLMQGRAPSSWVQFKQAFSSAWLTSTFEVDVMTAWHKLDAAQCENLQEYNKKFWEALLPVSSFRAVPLSEQIEKYCCGLPKEIRDYCTKTSVTNMSQLIENAATADALLPGKTSGYKQGNKDATSKAGKTGKPFKATFVAGKARRRPFVNWKTPAERKALMDAKKCFICEQEGHMSKECPQRKSKASLEDKGEQKGKKPKPSAGLVPDVVGEQPNGDATELCRAWGKVRDQTALVFFDPGARANFISPELASKLGIRAEEMGPMAEAGLACPGHSESVTPIIGKLWLHIQGYVDSEEFHIMPLEGCDVLLGIPWCHRVHAVVDVYNRKISLVHRGKTHVLDVKLKGESIPLVSASAISSVILAYRNSHGDVTSDVHKDPRFIDLSRVLRGFRIYLSYMIPVLHFTVHHMYDLRTMSDADVQVLLCSQIAQGGPVSNALAMEIVNGLGSVNFCDSMGRNPLVVAVSSGNVEMVHYLLENKANPGFLDGDNACAFLYAKAHSMQIYDVLRIGSGREILFGTRDLFKALNKDSPKSFELVLRAVLASSLDIDEINEDNGFTALGFAVSSRRLWAVKMLVEAGACPTKADARGTIPLQAAIFSMCEDQFLESGLLAAKNMDMEIVKSMIRRGMVEDHPRILAQLQLL